MTYDIIIVGAGIFGLSTAYELARRGRRVLAIDRFGSGHPATSSTGASRSIRIAYDHPFYVDLALEAIDSWHRLESETGRKILHLTGQIDIGPQGKLEDLARIVRSAGAAIESVDSAEVHRLFPEIVLATGEVALFQRQAGTVLADAGMAALLLAAQRAGVTYLAPMRVTRIEMGETVVKVHTEGRRFEAAQVVVAAGPWAKELLGEAGLNLPLAPAVAQVTFLDAPLLVDRPGIAEWRPNGETGIYGHPVPGIGYKIAFDAGAEGWQPDVEEWQPDLIEEKRILNWLTRRMPSVAPKVSRTQRHPWTMTPDVDFIVDRHGPIIVACGCSGHAFKFGPALGRFVADIVEGGSAPDLTRLDRMGLKQVASASAPITR
ncbi:FAD-dependent oxidoreductase [Phyllobacterium sp. UNC302MFCol5.2]|uniref:FAD-dependent oxidoreductase n=1 Tax=Phyllobacterium sp. UNC302MFCol5.2 TaxID=1449065 RepID=UPI0004899E61|nr:FAD-dependent oxidoreductase [Phyllobacterium sp. UNC302MFCol5.2]